MFADGIVGGRIDAAVFKPKIINFSLLMISFSQI
jgi:hypothetical protein